MSAVLIACGSALAASCIQSLVRKYGRPAWSDLAGPMLLVALVAICLGVLLFLEGQ